ncbi:MAG: MFS transporter, partial [Patescibacteria group bacterium]
RKKTLLIAEIFLFFGVLIFALAQSFLHIIISQIVFGIAVATISGTDSAFLFDTLKALGREDEHKKILGKFMSFFLITIAAGQIIGGFLGTVDLRLPVLLSIPIPLIRIVLILFLTEPPRENLGKSPSPLFHTASAIKWIFSSRVAVFLIFSSMVIALASKISIHTFNPYMEIIDVPIIYWGILMAVFNLLAAFIARQTHLIEKKLGSMNSFIFIFIIWILGFVLMAKVHIFLAFLWPLLHWVMRPFRDIFFSDQINKRTESSRRATVLSMASFAGQFLQVFALPVFGYIIDVWSLETMYLLMGGMLAVIGFIGWVGIKISIKNS